MARINIDGEQNVEVSIKIPCEKSWLNRYIGDLLIYSTLIMSI